MRMEAIVLLRIEENWLCRAPLAPPGSTPHYCQMREEPQAASYRADTPITALAPWLADVVKSAEFPESATAIRQSSVGAGGRSR